MKYLFIIVISVIVYLAMYGGATIGMQIQKHNAETNQIIQELTQ